MPDVIEMHTSTELVDKWVKYGILDSELTFLLFHTFKLLMNKLPVNVNEVSNTFELYDKYWRPFGELLTDIERRGIKVNKTQLMVVSLERKEVSRERLERAQKAVPRDNTRNCARRN